MKKVIYSSAILIMIVSLLSCNKDMIDEGDLAVLTKGAVILKTSTPVSGNEVVPVLLSGTSNRGGNVTCNEVSQAFNVTFTNCTDRISYVCNDYGCGFPGVPAEITIIPNSTNPKLIDFAVTGCIEGSYMVGAVIVKGATSANVYYYGPDGTMGDTGLGAPEGTHMVSNLTFCLIPCVEPEPLIVAMKCLYWKGGVGIYPTWAGSDGELPEDFTGTWCTDYMGITQLPHAPAINLLEGWNQLSAGYFTVTPEGEFLITLADERHIIDKVYIFIGTEDELQGTVTDEGCPFYEGHETNLWQLFDDPDDNSFTYSFVAKLGSER